MENKDSVSSNKLNISNKLKKLGIKKILLVMAVLTILLAILLVLFNKHNVNKSAEYSFSIKGMDLYCEGIYTLPTLEGKQIFCVMVAKNNGDMTVYLRRNRRLDLSKDPEPDIVVEPGAKERFIIKYKNIPDTPDTITGQIEIFTAKVPHYKVHGLDELQKWKKTLVHTLYYDIEYVGNTYVWKPLNT